ncbi:hypothetical protein BZL39_D00130 [Zygosaccharomyces parabailii]|nr:hypothetical protein BZL39_B10180 [Zygosaccharomyces parabailii]AQZ11961.1 hypothetical protein BZL39_D00130 [Zygosaccharomyces parabailii]
MKEIERLSTVLDFKTNDGIVECTIYKGKMPANYHSDKKFATSNFSMLITGFLGARKTSYQCNLNNGLAYFNLGAPYCLCLLQK